MPPPSGEYPALQTKMRAVLRVEVEAVRFLKEEPHKMDSMLKRVKALTETLSCLRRCLCEGGVNEEEEEEKEKQKHHWPEGYYQCPGATWG